jgi:hypothetical protein
MKSFISSIDILGINYFPPLVMDGATHYTVEQAASGLEGYRTDGKVLTDFLEDFSTKVPAKIVMSEVSFPTWRGSINWMFRHTCDGENSGKGGWEFTKGPLAPKQPSMSASLVLAAAWYDVFADEPWIHGASHVFWYRTWVDSERNAEFVNSGNEQCAIPIFRNEQLKRIIVSYYK